MDGTKFPRFSMKNSQNFQSRLRFVRLWAVMRTSNLGGNNSAFLLDNSETCYFINSYDDLKAESVSYRMF